MPIPIRKNGIKSAFPTNSIRFIKADVFGTSLFKAKPAIKAPIMASIPAVTAINDAIKTMAKIKIYCETLSLYRFINHLEIFGYRNKRMKPNIKTEMLNCIQKSFFNSPLTMPVIMARTNNERVTVTMVPPIVMLTARFFVIPNLLTMGYDTNVCEAYILASRIEVVNENSKM